ncbi:MAG: PEP-CTERM sorting domain-containing protein, partial [Planctomycetia bacterium]|nr:PEP-CTERM sorting domain-containing protein [Planctomycetia bacterium]
LDGDLMISAFSPTDYDTIAFADTQNVTLGNDFALILSLPDDTSEFNEKQNTLDVFSGLNDTTMFQNVDLYFSQSGWYGYINGNGQVVFGASNAVPEPSTWVLLALATLGIGYLRKR